MLNANDHKYPENIKGYGRCKADAQEVRRILQQHGNVTIDADKYAGRTCYPMLNEAWQDGDTYFTVEGAPALLDISTLVCARGGRIRFIKSSSEDFKAETTEIKMYAKLGTSEKCEIFGGERHGRIRNGVWRNKDKRGGKKE